MDLNPDFVDLVSLFEKFGVEYMVVGGAFALAAHGIPRFTGDPDPSRSLKS